MQNYVNKILESIKQKEPYNTKFLESTTDVLNSVIPYLEQNPHLKKLSLLEISGLISFTTLFTG